MVSSRSFLRATAAILAAHALAAPAAAQDYEIGFYLGWQTAPHSGVRGEYPGGGSYDFTTGWEGKSFEAPPHWGLRATWWFAERQGLAFDINHAKVVAEGSAASNAGFERLELTDGLNIATLNYMYRWPGALSQITPYVGAGVGISFPHVDATVNGFRTFEYQLGGPALAAIAGVSYGINERFNLFAEYKGTYSMNDLDLEGGGTLETDIVTNAVNAGVSFNF